MSEANGAEEVARRLERRAELSKRQIALEGALSRKNMQDECGRLLP